MQYSSSDQRFSLKIRNFIWTSDKTLTESFCQKCIDKFDVDQRKWQGLVGAGEVKEDIKKTYDLNISGLPEWKEEDKVFFKSLDTSIKKYCLDLRTLSEDKLRIDDLYEQYDINDTGYQLQRYEPDGFYDWHNDFQVHPEAGARIFTYIWYLNTIKKNQGGYTEFLDGTKVQPKAGRLVLFPATWNYMHRGFPPSGTNKYICTGWVHSKFKSQNPENQ